jgi:DNA-binding transcriptional LysR family regulator
VPPRRAHRQDVAGVRDGGGDLAAVAAGSIPARRTRTDELPMIVAPSTSRPKSRTARATGGAAAVGAAGAVEDGMGRILGNGSPWEKQIVTMETLTSPMPATGGAMRHVDPFALEMLITVADLGGFTAAADKLGRTQSAVSTRIADLEKDVGQKLLIRGARGVTLTGPGEKLVGHARRWLQQERLMLDDMVGLPAHGRVRLGMPDDYVDVFLRPIVARFATEHPGVEIEVRCDLSRQIEAEFNAGRFDLAVITRDHLKPTGELLRADTMVWAAARGHRPELEVPLPLALFTEVCRLRPRVLTALDLARVPYRIAYVSSHTAGVVSAVESGFCVTVLMESTLPPSLRRIGPDSGLPVLPPAEVAMLTPLRPEPAAARLAEAFREAFMRH